MKELKIPAFGEVSFKENKTNARARVFVISDVDADAFGAYCKLLSDNGYEKKESFSRPLQSYAAYKKGSEGIFLNYFTALRELYIVEEQECMYFSYSDRSANACVSAQITQVELEDFGASYAIRLPDGRFIVIDGGREFESDAERLWNCLREGSPDERPVIAMWILTHPHSDHFHGFMTFMDKYGDRVKVEKFLLNFPEHDDLEHYPTLAYKDVRFKDSSAYTNIPVMYDRIAKTGAPVYMAHTGQKYRIGDAELEILSCMDDTIHLTDSVNAISLIMRMELCGQVILWATDGPFSTTRLPEKFGEYLKSDILQVPHHGFTGGTAEGEIEGYKLIRPKVCLMPVSDFNAYYVFCAHKGGTKYLMTKAGIDEMITGTPQRTITLPYTAPESAKQELYEKYTHGQNSSGARTWIFTDLCTAEPEDFMFTFLNTTHNTATVWIELFFEDHHKNVRYIKVEVRSCGLRRYCIIGDDVDGDAVFFNWMSLKELGVPENAHFAARFMSDVPIVVSHRTHTPSHKA